MTHTVLNPASLSSCPSLLLFISHSPFIFYSYNASLHISFSLDFCATSFSSCISFPFFLLVHFCAYIQPFGYCRMGLLLKLRLQLIYSMSEFIFVLLVMRCGGGKGAMIEGPPVAGASHSGTAKRTLLVQSGTEWSHTNQPPMRECGRPESSECCMRQSRPGVSQCILLSQVLSSECCRWPSQAKELRALHRHYYFYYILISVFILKCIFFKMFYWLLESQFQVPVAS